MPTSQRSLALLLAAFPLVAGAETPPCPHPYFPIQEGLKLHYRAGGSDLVLGYGEVQATPGGGQKAKLSVDFKKRQGSAEATCTAEGVSTGLGGLEGALLGASGLEVQVVDSKGVVVPPPAQMVPGGTWKNMLSVKMQPPASLRLPGGMRPIISTTFDKESTVVGEEEVTVKAGKFKALKVKNRTTARSSGEATPRSLDSFLWFAPNVGLVKIATGDSVDLELLEVERPKPTQAAKRLK